MSDMAESIARTLADFYTTDEEVNWRDFEPAAFSVLATLANSGVRFPRIDEFDEAACAAGFSTREEAISRLMELAIGGSIPDFCAGRA